MDKQKIIEMIDYTLLKPTASKEDIRTFCLETIQYGFNTVFVNPYYVKFANDILKDHGVKVGVPIGFSLGGATTKTKITETVEAIQNGATEIDMLINLGALKSKEYEFVQYDIEEVVKASSGLTTKVIIETALLTEEEKITASKIVMAAGADYVKTATGFNGGGATVEDVKLLKSVVGENCKVKAAGGIRSLDDAVKFMEAGASRLGTSNAIPIINGLNVNSSY